MQLHFNTQLDDNPPPDPPTRMQTPDPIPPAAARRFLVAGTADLNPNLSVGRRAPLVSELVEPLYHTPGAKYFVVHVGSQVGIFETWKVAHERARCVTGGVVKSADTWPDAVAIYADCINRNDVRVLDPKETTLSPGNNLDNPIPIFSAAPTPEQPLSSPPVTTPATPTPAQRERRAIPKPKLKRKDTALPAPNAKGASSAATRIRKKVVPPPSAQDPKSGPTTVVPEDDDMYDDDDDDMIIKKGKQRARSPLLALDSAPAPARSPSVAVLSGPTVVVKPAPRPEDIISIHGSSSDEAPDEAPPSPAATPSQGKKAKSHGKQLKPAPNKLYEITEADVERALAASASRKQSAAATSSLPPLAPAEIKRVLEAAAERVVKRPATSSSNVHTPIQHASGSSARSARSHAQPEVQINPYLRYLHKDGKSPSASHALPSQTRGDGKSAEIQPPPYTDYPHMDGKSPSASSTAISQSCGDVKSGEVHTAGDSDEYPMSDWDLSDGGKQEMEYVLANPTVPSPSKFRAMGKLRREQMKK